MDMRLYLICNRFEALVASQLCPEDFGAYLATGPLRQTTGEGEVLFIEIDQDKVGEPFDLEWARRHCVPHSDGSPKRSKYLSIYRVLEHIPMEAYGTLHMTTRDGRVLGVDHTDKPIPANGGTPANMYMELSPIKPLVVSCLQPAEFIQLLTDFSNPIHVPKLFMADMLVDTEPDGHLAAYLPYPNREHIEDCLRQVTSKGGKATKIVNRNPARGGFFRTIRRGFFLGDQTQVLYYPFPDKDTLDEYHHKWWRSASLGW